MGCGGVMSSAGERGCRASPSEGGGASLQGTHVAHGGRRWQRCRPVPPPVEAGGPSKVAQVVGCGLVFSPVDHLSVSETALRA